jgi:hypothetical protein
VAFHKQRKKSPPPKIVFKNLAFYPLSFYLGPSKENKLHGSKIRDKVFLDTESTGFALNPQHFMLQGLGSTNFSFDPDPTLDFKKICPLL